VAHRPSRAIFSDFDCDGQFVRGNSKRPENIRNAQDVLAWYDANLPPALARARGLSGENLAKIVDFRPIQNAR